MKRLSLAIMFVFCTLAMAAQDGIKVKFQGASPDIMDFAWRFLLFCTQFFVTLQPKSERYDEII